MSDPIEVTIDPDDPVVTIHGQGCTIVLTGATEVREVRNRLHTLLLVIADRRLGDPGE